MTTTTSRYTSELGRRLRLRGLGDAEISEAISTVEEHVRESGHAPTESFGTPRAYARTFAARGAAPRRAWVYVLGWLVAAAAGALLWLGIDARADQGRVFDLLDADIAVAVSVAVLLLWVGALVHRLTRAPRG
ncbi:hypothetical protein [Cellulomonas oligotrophica]|uniref:Uncharacterized protein n=1 Tax=Cellulomonas oligotrophica TaxID=931536 RepID=A0A7Y9FIB1_9CELL|nr:hypothetical protein [Cellulomonas oligotrophica]NYD87848.1 hypothetical protein [Cellulomonas oligotrophica]GIG32945.1 hypothetical protein Col01nite_21040 [Cellulomonas oligotrophica]